MKFGVAELRKLMDDVSSSNEYQLTVVDMGNPIYWIWKAENVRIKELYEELEHLRPESSRFDVFVNTNFISKNDYEYQQLNSDFLIKFKKENFDYSLDTGDTIIIRGDLESIT